MRNCIRFVTALVLSSVCCIAQSWTVSIPNRATYSLCADPQNPQILYAGNVARTIFKSTDGGVIWEERAVGTQGGTSVIQLVAVHPRKSNIVFAAGQGMSGLERSTDGGATWTTVLDTPDGFRFELGGTSALAFDPNHPDTIYVIRFSYGDVFRSADGGANWEALSKLPDLETSDNMRAVTVCPDSSNVVMISGRRSRIYRSTDYGKTWTIAQALSAHIDADVANFAWSPTTKGTVYATVQKSLFYLTGNAGLYKSTDYGITWKCNALADTSISAILVSKTKTGDELLLGGCQIIYPSDNGNIRGDSLVFRSVPGTDTLFTQISDVPWTENETGVFGYNVYAFAVTQRDGYPVVLMATNGGLFVSNNITSVKENETHAPFQPLVIRNSEFVVPEYFKGACQYVVTDILGRVTQSGYSQSGSTIRLDRATQLLYVTASDGSHVARAIFVP